MIIVVKFLQSFPLQSWVTCMSDLGHLFGLLNSHNNMNDYVMIKK
jgi:hypothetical protein